MTESKAVTETVVLPARTIHLEPVDHPRPWRLAVASASDSAPTAHPRVALHLTDTDVRIFAGTLLHPPRPQDRPPGRALLIRDGFGLRLRVFVDSVDGDEVDRPEPRTVVHIEEHHREILLKDIARHRPDLLPTTTAPEPRLRLDQTPITGLTIDQVTQLHDHLTRWLDDARTRAAIADRAIARRLHIPDDSR
ncbi:hypothetical protein [Embleya sp. AB8]|uniref:hypothetical protein n=1 Tax=Embleya sp. AB8 TaxID=3156304 RepID=UPI003C758D35